MVLVLAVGIGVNTALFSLVNSLLLRPLPYPDSEEIVSVGQSPVGRPGVSILSPPALRRLWRNARSFDHLAAYSPVRLVWDGPDGAVDLIGASVTPSLFLLLRTTPRLGRLFTEAEGDGVVLLSHGAWAGSFGSDPDVVGAPVTLDDQSYTVVGVLPEGFDFPDSQLDFWKPLVVAQGEGVGEDGEVVFPGALTGLGRLRSGVSPAQAEVEVRTILGRSGSDLPSPPGLELETQVSRLKDERGRAFRPAVLMLAVATGLVLAMACANVGGLLVARGIARQQELAVRVALGARRRQIVRQLLTESLVLSVTGGTVGLAVAAGIVHAAPGIVPGSVPGLDEIRIDRAVISFAAGLSVAAGLLFGAAPAIRSSRIDLARTINERSAASTSGFGRLRTNRGQAGLAITQVALATVLLTATGLLLRSFTALITFDFGLDPTNVVVATVQSNANSRLLTGTGGRLDTDALEGIGAAVRRSAETLLAQLDRVARLPNVDAVTLSSGMPLFPDGALQPIDVVGHPPARDPRNMLFASTRTVSPGYANVMRLQLRAGRFFTRDDTVSSPRVVVVSESFAREAFRGKPAVGQRLVQPDFISPGVRAGLDRGRGNEPWEVVGVVADVAKPFGTDDLLSAAAGEIYLSMLQPGMGGIPALASPTVIVRTVDDPLAVIPFLREVLAEVEPRGRVATIVLQTMLSARAAQPYFYAAGAGLLGAAALLLAAFGLYSMLSYAVSRHQKEIGIRIALGAVPSRVVMLVVRQGGALVAAGVALGLSLVAVATSVFESLLFGVTPTDPLTLAAVTAVLFAVALSACWIPARRAARINPLDVLHET